MFHKKMTYRLILAKAFQSQNIYNDIYVLLFELYINRYDRDLKSFVFEIRKKQ